MSVQIANAAIAAVVAASVQLHPANGRSAVSTRKASPSESSTESHAVVSGKNPPARNDSTQTSTPGSADVAAGSYRWSGPPSPRIPLVGRHAPSSERPWTPPQRAHATRDGGRSEAAARSRTTHGADPDRSRARAGRTSHGVVGAGWPRSERLLISPSVGRRPDLNRSARRVDSNTPRRYMARAYGIGRRCGSRCARSGANLRTDSPQGSGDPAPRRNGTPLLRALGPAT